MNFQFNAIIYVFHSQVFPVMKFGELLIIGKDKNNHTINIFIRNCSI